MLFPFWAKIWDNRARSIHINPIGRNFTISRFVFMFLHKAGKPDITGYNLEEPSTCPLFPNLQQSPLYAHFQIGFCQRSKSTCLPYVLWARVTSPVVLLLCSWKAAARSVLPSFPLRFEEQGTTPPTWHLSLFLSQTLCFSTKTQFYQRIPLGGSHDWPFLSLAC